MLAQQPQDAADDHHRDGRRDDRVRGLGKPEGGGAGGDEDDQDDHRHAHDQRLAVANLLALVRCCDPKTSAAPSIASATARDQFARGAAITNTTSPNVSKNTTP